MMCLLLVLRHDNGDDTTLVGRFDVLSLDKDQAILADELDTFLLDEDADTFTIFLFHKGIDL